MKTLSRILRSHFNPFAPNAPFLYPLTVFWCFQRVEKECIENEWVKEPNATSLFTDLSNSKYLPSESAEEFVVRPTSLRKKILFISKEDNWSPCTRLFLVCYFGWIKENRNELCLSLKNSILPDENILENLMLVMSDEQEHFQKFKKRVDINSIEPWDRVPIAIRPKHQSENPIIAEIRSLKSTLDSISTWRGNFEKREESLPKPDTLPRRCPSCRQNNISRCVHCFYCGPTWTFSSWMFKTKTR